MRTEVRTIVLKLDARGFELDHGGKQLIRYGLTRILGGDLIKVKFLTGVHFSVIYRTPETADSDGLRLSLSEFVCAHVPVLALFSEQYGEIFL